MAHFARLNPDGYVDEVIVVNNDVLENLPFPESEPLGVAFLKSIFGPDTIWAQTSYNANFRGNFAGTGFLFDPSVTTYGAFIPPKIYDSWILDLATYQWEPPIPPPQDGQKYLWNEDLKVWQLRSNQVQT